MQYTCYKMKKNSHSSLDTLVNNLSITKNCIIYTRCSTKQQNQDNLHSIASQIEICTHYANKCGFNIINVLSDIKPGHDITKLAIYDSIFGNPIGNTNGNTIVNINNIIIKDPSRLSREPDQGTKFVMDCLKAGIIIHSVSDKIDTSINSELKLFNSLFHDAYIESQQVSKRIRTTLEAKKRNGGVLGRAPYGKKLVKITAPSGLPIQKTEDDEIECDIMHFISMLYFGDKLDLINNYLERLSTINEIKLYWVDDKTAQAYIYDCDVLYGYFTYGFIAQVLNHFGILQKGKLWLASSISTVIQKIKIVNPNPICLTSNGKEFMYEF